MNKSSQRTAEETFLGRFYLSIHQRAEYLRQKQASTETSDNQPKEARATTQLNKPSEGGSSV